MSIYSKGGDKGTTSLIHTKNLSKSDDRIQLIGVLDELNSHIRLIRMDTGEESEAVLEEIQKTLKMISDGVSDSYNREFKLNEKVTSLLEREMERMVSLFHCPDEAPLAGTSRTAAQIDLAGSVARRAERTLAAVSVKFGADKGAKVFLNRLSDYLYVLARYTEETGVNKVTIHSKTNEQEIRDAVMQEVLRQMNGAGKITLSIAKQLIEKIEEEALRRGSKAVIAVCGSDGNPIAVHVMDDAYLVSFDVAMKKAYTAVAVKMSTMELSVLAQPGGTFYGVDKMDGGKIVIFGGGILLRAGERIVGGLGISGGTGEEDHSLAEYGAEVLKTLL